MNGPTQTLSREHRVIESVLDVLDAYARNLTPGADSRDRLADLVTFFRTFADTCHHGKEEGLLFPALEKSGMPREGGPVGVMLTEHDQGRVLVRRLAAVAEGTGPLSEEECSEVVTAAGSFSSLLRQHIQKEDRILFPMADQVLSPEQQRELYGEFETFEEEVMGKGVHEQMHKLAESLIEGVIP